MTKFLRKYNKLILVIGGALLMVAWLLPQTLQQFGRSGANAQYMRIDGRKITVAQADEAQRRFSIVRELLGTRNIQGLPHWLLLTHEARLNGLIGGPADGRELLAALAAQQAQQAAMFGQNISAEEIRTNLEAILVRLAGSARVTIDEAYQALADYRGIDRLVSLTMGNTFRVSDRRTVREGLKQFNQATVDYVFIPAEFVLDQIPEPDDAALTDHLERFRDVRPAEGEYGIGYTLPPRAKVEWLVLDREAIANASRVSRIEIMERYLKENPSAGNEPISEAKRTEIESALRKENADRAIAEAEKAIRSEFAKVLRKLPKRGDAYVLPADWDQQRPDLHVVRDAVVEAVRRTGLEIPAPTVVVKDAEWLTERDLAGLEGIGLSTVQRGNARESFSRAVLSVTEAGGKGDLGIQTGVPGSVSRDFAGNLYYFTVLAALPESPATSVDEIRPKLAADKRRFDAFKLLQRDAEVYRQRAANEGLEALVPSLQGYESLPPGWPELRRSATFSRSMPSWNDPRLSDEKTRDAIITAAERLDPTKDASTVPAEDRTVAVPVPSQMGLAVVRINAFRPMTVEAYRQRDSQLASRVGMTSVSSDDDPFTLEHLAERHNAELPPQREGDES